MAEDTGIALVCERADEARFESFTGHFRLARAADPEADFHLAYDGHRLALFRRGDAKGVCVELSDIERRLRGQFLLGRACGVQRSRAQRVLDATAGLGLDGMALALSGQTVHLVERHPVLWALLDDLCDRVGAGIVAELTLGDSFELLAQRDDCYDVIYCDPMFEPRGKTALPGKRMQYLAALLGETVLLDEAMLELARDRATSRVVLKRRAKDRELGSPDWTIRGRAVRYDVYRGKAPAAGATTGEAQPSSRMA